MGLAVLLDGDRLQRRNLSARKSPSSASRCSPSTRWRRQSTTFIGFLLVIAVALAWAIGNIIASASRGEHAPDMFALVVWSSLIPPLPLAALSYALERRAAALHAVVTMSATAWACVAVMAYGARCWIRLVERFAVSLPDRGSSPFALLIPVSGIASGAMFLGEKLAPLQAAGVTLVFGPGRQYVRAPIARVARDATLIENARRYSPKITIVVLPWSGIDPPLWPDATATYCFPFSS